MAEVEIIEKEEAPSAPMGGEKVDLNNKNEIVDCDNLNAPQWLKDGLKKLDTDGDGLEKEEVAEMLETLAAMKKAAKNNSSDLDYSKFPENVKDVMREWDGDGSGTVSVSELSLAAEAQKKMASENKFMKQMLGCSVLLILVMTISMYFLSLTANEATKDFVPATNGEGNRRRRLSRLLEDDEESAETETTTTETATVDPANNRPVDGQLQTEDGTGIATASTVRTPEGCDLFTSSDSVFKMNPTELSNIESAVLPGTGSPIVMKQLVDAKKGVDMNGKATVEFKDQSGLVLKMVMEPDTVEGGSMHVKYPSGLVESLGSCDASLRRRRLQQDNSTSTSTCPTPGTCNDVAPRMTIGMEAVGAPAENTTAMPNSDEICMDPEFGCEKEEWETYNSYMNITMEESNDNFDWLDCDGNGVVSPKEQMMGGICARRALEHCKNERHPDRVTMTENGMDEDDMLDLLEGDRFFVNQIHLDCVMAELHDYAVMEGYFDEGDVNMGVNEGEDAVRAMMNEMDPEKNGYYGIGEFEEFISALMPTTDNLATEKTPRAKPVGIEPKCNYFKVDAVTSPDMFEMPLGSATDALSRKQLFNELDRSGDGMVTREECAGSDMPPEVKMFQEACMGLTGECNSGKIEEKEYCAHLSTVGNEAETCGAMMVFKDVNFDGYLDMDEFTQPTSQASFESQSSCIVRQLQEELVHKPRRKMRRRRLAIRERRLRANMKRRLGSSGDFHSWLNKRQLKASEEVNRRKRRMQQVERRLQEDSSRRRLDWEEEQEEDETAAAESIDNDADLAAEDSETIDYMIDYLAPLPVDEHEYALDILKDVLSNMTCTDYSERILLADDDLHWDNSYGSRKVVGRVVRKLQAVNGTDESAADSARAVKILEKVVKSGVTGVAKMKSKMGQAAHDDAARDALMLASGGVVISPIQKHNLDGSTICEMPCSPLASTARKMRFLKREARVLSVKDSKSEHGRRVLSDQHEEQRSVMKRYLQTAETTVDACDTQILSGPEVHKFMVEELGRSEKEISTMLADEHEVQRDMAADMERRIRRMLRDVELHPEDMRQLRELTTEAGNEECPDSPDVLTPCGVMKIVDPLGYAESLADPDVEEAMNAGDLNYCTIPEKKKREERRRRRHADDDDIEMHEVVVMPETLVPGNMERHSDGNFVKKDNPTKKVTFAMFAQTLLRDPHAPEACKALPPGERTLPLDPDTLQFNETSNPTAALNLAGDMMGPGCLEECGCLTSTADGAIVDMCTEQDVITCPCMVHKNKCHAAVMDKWNNKGGDAGDGADEGMMDGAASRRTRKQRRRKLRGKAIFRHRIEKKKLRKLLPISRKAVFNDIKVEKERRRRIRRRIRQLMADIPQEDTKRRQLHWEEYDAEEYFENYDVNITTIHLPVCGDDPHEICPCDPDVDGDSCIGGMELSELSQSAMHYGQVPFEEACPICPDLTSMAHELERKLARKAESNEWSNSANDTHMDSIGHATENGTFSPNLLTPEMKELAMDMVMSPCVANPEAFLEIMTLDAHPPAFDEAMMLIEEGLMMNDVTQGEMNQNTVFEDIQAMGASSSDDVTPAEAYIYPEDVEYFLTACDDAQVMTNEENCEAASALMENMEAMSYGSGDDEFIMTEEDMDEMAYGSSHEDLMPDEEGGINIGAYVCEMGMKYGMDPATATANFHERTGEKAGKLMQREMIADDVVSAMRKQRTGSQSPEEMKTQAQEKLKQKESSEQKRSTKQAKNMCMDTYSRATQEDAYMTLRRTLRELSDDGNEDGHRRKLTQTELRRLNDDVLLPVRRKLSSGFSTTSYQAGDMISHMMGGHTHDTLMMYRNCTSELAHGEAQRIKNRTTELLESGLHNYSAPAYAMHTTDIHDEMHAIERVIDHCDAVLERLDEAIYELEENVQANRTSGALWVVDNALLNPTLRPGWYPDREVYSGFTWEDAEEIAMCLSGLMDMPEEGFHDSERVCHADFVEFMSYDEPNPDEWFYHDLDAEWDAMTYGAGVIPDEMGCVPEDILYEMPPPFEADDEELYGYDEYVSDDMSSTYIATRRLHVMPHIDWRRMGEADVITMFDPASNVNLPAGTPLENKYDARLMKTGCMPWEVTVDQFVHQAKEAIAAGSQATEAALVQGEQVLEAIAESPSADQTHMTPHQQQQTAKGFQEAFAEKQGKCEEGKTCDPMAADAAIEDDALQMYFSSLNGGGDMCMLMDLPQSTDCDMYGLSDLTMMEDANGDQIADNWAYFALSYSDLCRKEKEHQRKKKELEQAFTNQTQIAATQVATARLRRRLLRMMKAKPDKVIHHAVRRLAGLGPDFRDNYGRRLSEKFRKRRLHDDDEYWDEDDYESSDHDDTYWSNEYEDPYSWDEANDYALEWIEGADASYEDVLMLQNMQQWDQEVSDVIHNWVDDYEEEQSWNMVEMRSNYSVLAAQMGNLPEDTDHFRDIVSDLAYDLYSAGEAVYDICAVMPYGDMIASPGDDIDGDGVADDEELSYCITQLLPEMPEWAMEEFQQVANGQMAMRDILRTHLPEAANATAMQEIKDIMTMSESKCYVECATADLNIVGEWGYWNGYPHWYEPPVMDADCDMEYVLGANRSMSLCQVLSEYGNPEMYHEAMMEASVTARRLTVKKRKLEIQEKRRRLQGDAGTCMVIDGRNFCPEGVKPAEIQEREDHFEAIGVRYLVADYSTRRLKGKKKNLSMRKSRGMVKRKVSRKSFARKKKALKRRMVSSKKRV